MDMPENTNFLTPLEEVLAEERGALGQALEGLAQHATEAASVVQQLQAALETQRQAVRDQEAKVQEALESAKSASGGNAEAEQAHKEEAARLEGELQEARRLAETSAKRVAEWEAEAKSRNADAEAAENLINDLKSALEDRDKETNALQRQIEETKAALEARDQEEGSQSERVSALEEEQKKLQDLLASKETALTELEAVAARADDESVILREKIATLETECKGLREDAQSGEEAARESAELRDALKEKEQVLDELKIRIEEVETEAAAWKMKTESAPAPETLAELERRLAEESERAASLEEQLESERSKGTKSALAEQLAEALREAENAQNELRQLKRSPAGGTRTAPPTTDSGLNALQDARRVVVDDEAQRIRVAAKGGHGKKSIGEILESAGIVTRDQISQAMEEQRKNPMKHLGGIFVDWGFASPEAVAQALACQCDAEFIHLGEDQVEADAASLINARLAQQHTCIPISASEERLRLALVNPMDLLAIEDVERSSGREVEVVVATATDIKAAIEKFYWEPE